MTPIDCRTCDYYEAGYCSSLVCCENADMYRHTKLVRLYVVTEQEKQEEAAARGEQEKQDD